MSDNILHLPQSAEARQHLRNGITAPRSVPPESFHFGDLSREDALGEVLADAECVLQGIGQCMMALAASMGEWNCAMAAPTAKQASQHVQALLQHLRTLDRHRGTLDMAHRHARRRLAHVQNQPPTT